MTTSTPADPAPRRAAAVKRFGFGAFGLPFGELNPGDTQRRIRMRPEHILGFPYAFAAVTLIVNDIGKIRLQMMQTIGDTVEPARTGGPLVKALLRLLVKPNRLQTIKSFIESWVACLIIYGEAFILIERDEAGRFPVALHVLDPWRVQAKVTPEGRVIYDLSSDNIAGLPARVGAPASDIIHHVFNALFHPLCGISPLDPIALSVTHGLSLLESQVNFFANGAQPGGVLSSASTEISEDEAERLREEWDAAFTGGNAGRVAVLGYGLEYKPIALSQRDAQVKDQFNVTAEMIGAALHIPKWKILGTEPPSGYKPSDLNQIYYGDCLQSIIEGIEGHLDVALGAPENHHFEFRVTDLLRMDEKAQMETLEVGVAGKILAINDARRRLGFRAVPGGDQPWMQMQDFPIEMLLQMQSQIASAGGERGDQTQRAAAAAMRWLS